MAKRVCALSDDPMIGYPVNPSQSRRGRASMRNRTRLAVGTSLAVALLTTTPATGATVITQAVYNASSPGAAFTPADPLGTILNTPLYEAVNPKTGSDMCTSGGNCTYDFTFTLVNTPTGSTIQVQLAAAVQVTGSSIPEVLNFDLFSGAPGSATFTPISSPTFIAASGPANTVGQVTYASLSNGQYYVQVTPSAVAVSGENASGSMAEIVVPEPVTWTLIAAGIGGVSAALRRRRGALDVSVT